MISHIPHKAASIETVEALIAVYLSSLLPKFLQLGVFHHQLTGNNLPYRLIIERC